MRFIHGLFLAGSLFLLTGCQPAETPPAAVNETAEPTAEERAAARIEEAMSELSEEDRAAAMAQKICPVSDEPLGSMGAPIKLQLDGQDVFICCEGCRKPAEENPAEMLAKLQPAAGDGE